MSSSFSIVSFPSRTWGPQECISKGDNAISAPKDVRKEDYTIVAEEDVSVGENTISAPEDGGGEWRHQ
ncbi:hypothetical protein RHMOL_Rhmol08G0110000 [Rhododendron molle]|uniref:Uncharacterized protein n=1 Tax=Rhododendron molle TaxID=49168 RepID=A0ACC0MP42_RHOML|nr:hypothetical protein RHMOL_Rhmol08G0110000 [Rhododendron molle]